MERWVGKVAVVTGTSAGIGAAIAETLVKDGIIVAGLARRKERVEQLAEKLKNHKGKLHAIKCDVSKEDEVVEAFKWIEKNLGPVHILVNNAGILRDNELIDGDYQKWKEIIDTNVMGLCVATREAVKSMKENKVDGHIIHINSGAGHRVVNLSNLNIYFASKHAVTALAETLRYEFLQNNLNIKISSVSPGTVETEIKTAAGLEKRRKLPEHIKNIFVPIESKDVADAVSYVLGTPPNVQISELIIKPMHEPY